jgi:hypothetical protein
MKKATTVISLISVLIGCSKDAGSSGKSKRLVPATAAEVVASPDYKLEHITQSGIKCYVRRLTPEIARTVSVDSRDYEFLNGDERSALYFLVLIRDWKILETESTSRAMSPAEANEVMSSVMKMQDMLEEAGKK